MQTQQERPGQDTPSPYGQKPQVCFQRRCVKLSGTADRQAYYLGEEKPPVALLACVSSAGDLITVHVFIFSSMVVNNAVKAVGTVITETSTSQLQAGGGLVFTKTVSISLQRLNSEAQACSYHGEGPGNGWHSHNPGLYFERVYCKGNLLCVIMYFLVIMYFVCIYVFSCYYALFCLYRETCTLFIFLPRLTSQKMWEFH